jgi:hypothetical protein
VYDVSSRPTFDELLRWFRELDTYCGEGVVKVLVGNKVDKVSYSSHFLCVQADMIGVLATGLDGGRAGVCGQDGNVICRVLGQDKCWGSGYIPRSRQKGV